MRKWFLCNLPQVTRIGDNLILHPYQLIVVETTKK